MAHPEFVALDALTAVGAGKLDFSHTLRRLIVGFGTAGPRTVRVAGVPSGLIYTTPRNARQGNARQ